MRVLDFILMMFVCLIWALNIIVGKVMLTTYGIPPIYYAAIRFLGVAVVLAPLLRPVPQQLGRIAIVGLLVGAGHFALMFIGLQFATPSSAAIVLQFGIPMTTILSVIFLGERLTSLRFAGIGIAFAGVMVVVWNPDEAKASIGLVAIVGSTASIAIGSVLLKKLKPIHPLRLQAWVALVSWAPLALLSALFETRQVEASMVGGYAFLAAAAFSVLIVTVVAHTAYFSLLQRYDASMIAPLTLAMPVMSITLGVMLIGDPLTLQVIAGSVLCLTGVALVLKGGRRRRGGGPDSLSRFHNGDARS